jgi:hypothetical protein
MPLVVYRYYRHGIVSTYRELQVLLTDDINGRQEKQSQVDMDIVLDKCRVCYVYYWLFTIIFSPVMCIRRRTDNKNIVRYSILYAASKMYQYEVQAILQTFRRLHGTATFQAKIY